MSGKRTYTSGQPSKQMYKCPVKNCDSDVRGDDVTKHFRTYGNLDALDKTSKIQSQLSKNSKAGDAIDLANEYLESLLEKNSEKEKKNSDKQKKNSDKEKKNSDKEKEHTKYLFHYGYNSTKLPDYNAINFKCQQKTNVAGNTVDNYFNAVPKKVMKLSGETNMEIDDSSEFHSTESVLEPDSVQGSTAVIQPTKLIQKTNDLDENVVNSDEKSQENKIVGGSEDKEAANEFGLKNLVSMKPIDWIAEKVVEKIKKIIEWIPDKVVEKLTQVNA